MKNSQLLLSLVALMLLSTSVLAATKYNRVIWDKDPSRNAIIAFSPSGTSNLPYIKYGTSPDENSWAIKYVTDSQMFGSIKSNFVRLSGLTGNSNIYYRVCDSSGCGQHFWFKTAPTDNSPFIVVAGGDSRTGITNRREGNKLIAKIRPLFIMHGGDFTSHNTSSDMKKYLDDWKLTFSSDSIGGESYKRIYPFIPTHGNHEDHNFKTLCQVFGTDFNQDGVCNEHDTYGAFNVSALLRVYTLNSQFKDGWNSHANAMNNWLSSDLVNNRASAKWYIAQYHKPMYPHTRGKSDNRILFDWWAQKFYDNKMNLVVESDSHITKVTKPLKISNNRFVETTQGGTVYVGEGSWGAPARSANDPKSWTIDLASIQQFKVITVKPNVLEVRTAQFDGSPSTLSLVDRQNNSTLLPTGINWWNVNNIGNVINLGQNNAQRTIITDGLANEAPVANAGVDKTVNVYTATTLNGTVTDDGFEGTSLTTTWTKQSGPGSVTFTDPNVAVTNVSFSAEGTYTLRLTVADGQFSVTDDVVITVAHASNNQPPTANAGSDRRVYISASATTLNGTVTDDGFDGNSLTTTWTRQSGPGSVTFTTPNAAVTNVSFSVAGDYILRLTATDGQFSVTDDMAITVTANNFNQEPIVNAGADKTVEIHSEIHLDGVVVDDDFSGNTLHTAWTEVSGHGTATFTDRDNIVTKVVFSDPGTYTLLLAANDGDYTPYDTVTINVVSGSSSESGGGGCTYNPNSKGVGLMFILMLGMSLLYILRRRFSNSP